MKKKLLCIALAFVFTVGLGLTAQAEDLALPAPSWMVAAMSLARSWFCLSGVSASQVLITTWA